MQPVRMFQVKIVMGVALLAASYCAAAGRIDLWPGWCYAGFSLVTLAASYVALARVAPDIIVERVSWHAGMMRWDKPIVMWLMFGPIAACAAAGLEARRHGVEPPGMETAFGYAVGLTGSAATLWATAVNRFDTPVVRIQKERGHKVVENGPYRIVRHPGNLGNIILSIATPPMLASRWAWMPAGLSVAVIVIRTALEDRMLRRELPGYAGYAERTRSRLIPGLW